MQLRDFARTFVGLDRKALTPADYTGVPGVYDDTPNQRVTNPSARQHLQHYGGDLAVDWITEAIDYQAHTAAAVEWELEKAGRRYVQDKSDASPKDAGQAPPALVELLQRPNSWVSWRDLIQLTVIDYRVTGDAYWLKFRPNEEGKPLALYRLHPGRMTIVPGADRPIAYYEYNKPGQSEPVKYMPWEVLHFRRPNPHSDQYGLGVIEGGAEVVDTEIALTRSQKAFHQRGGRFSGVLQSPRLLGRETLSKIRRAFGNLYAGAENAGSIPILQNGLEFKPVSANAQDAAFEALTAQSRDRVCALMGTPTPLLHPQGFDYRAVREAQRVFDEHTMRPMLADFEAAISRGLTQAWGYDFVIPYEYKLTLDDAAVLASQVGSIPGIRIREVRELLGLPPLGNKNDEMVLNLPGDNSNASKIKDRPLAGEPGRPPNPENTAAIPPPGGKLPNDASAQAQPAKA